VQQRHIIVLGVAIVLWVDDDLTQDFGLTEGVASLDIMHPQFNHQGRGGFASHTMGSSQCPATIDE
jgi:hypothetical protein